MLHQIYHLLLIQFLELQFFYCLSSKNNHFHLILFKYLHCLRLLLKQQS
nr:MAG TPA: hypothetical protein [Caudoviricetes sp.]